MKMKRNIKLSRLKGKSILLFTFFILTPFYNSFASSANVPTESNTIQKHGSIVRGTVVDKDGKPLIGVNIVVSGANGTITDINGRFSINATPQSVLKVSYIGYTSQAIKVGTNKEFHIVMVEDNKTLDEVVIVGYGSQKKVTVTGSVAAVQNRELTQSAAANLSTALAGRLPG